MDELKPCPFCGGEAYLNSRYAKYGYMVFVRCDVCGAEGKKFNSYDEPPSSVDWDNSACRAATRFWNMRLGK